MAQYKNDATHVVTTIIFNDLEKAKTGFEMIKDLEAIKEIEMEQMVLAERNETDGFSFIDAIDFTQQDQSFKGSLIGMAVGVVGGPFGMLVGSVAGYLIGANRDEKTNAIRLICLTGHSTRSIPTTTASSSSVRSTRIRKRSTRLRRNSEQPCAGPVKRLRMRRFN
ncbi:hypothetical protein [Exiguobacterium artemiae]